MGFLSRSMMWRSRRLWLLFIAVFLLKDAAGLGVWNTKSAQPWYGGAASVSMDQPTKVDYLPGLTKLEGSISSDTSMPSSSVLPQQGLGPSPIQAGKSACGSSSQMAASEAVTASGSAGSSQSVFPGGQQVSGLLVSQPQLQGSSGVVGTWRQSSKSDVGTPQISSHLFQQGAWHQGSSSSLPTPQGSSGAVSSGLIKYLPAEKPHPSIPQQPQSSPQLPHPSQTKPVGSVSVSTPLQGSSGSSAWIPTGLLGHPLASQHSSGSSSDAPQEGPSYRPLPVLGGGTWQTTGWQTAQSPMPSSGLTLTKYYGPQYSQGVGAWLPSSHDQPSVQTALSQMAASHGKSGATVQQVASDAVPGLIPTGLLKRTLAFQHSSGSSDLFSTSQQSFKDASYIGSYPWQPAQPVVQGSDVASKDVSQTSSKYYGPPSSQGAAKWQVASYDQTAQTQMTGSSVSSDLPSTSQQSSKDAVKQGGSSYIVSYPSQTASVWQTAQPVVQGSDVASKDVPQTSNRYYGPQSSHGAAKWQVASYDQPSVQTALAENQGSSVQSSVTTSQSRCISCYPGLLPTQRVGHQPVLLSDKSQLWGSPKVSGMTTSQQSSNDAAQTSSSSYGSLPPQVVSTWQTSSFQSPPQTVLKQDPALHGSHSVINQGSLASWVPSRISQNLGSLTHGWAWDAVKQAGVSQPASDVASGKGQQSSVQLTSGSPSSSYSFMKDLLGHSSYQSKPLLPSSQFSWQIKQ